MRSADDMIRDVGEWISSHAGFAGTSFEGRLKIAHRLIQPERRRAWGTLAKVDEPNTERILEMVFRARSNARMEVQRDPVGEFEQQIDEVIKRIAELKKALIAQSKHAYPSYGFNLPGFEGKESFMVWRKDDKGLVRLEGVHEFCFEEILEWAEADFNDRKSRELKTPRVIERKGKEPGRSEQNAFVGFLCAWFEQNYRNRMYGVAASFSDAVYPFGLTVKQVDDLLRNKDLSGIHPFAG